MNRKGFTIIELAVVLVIMGILVGIGAGLMGSLTKRAKINEARETVSAATDAVVGYAVSNSRVPTLAQFPNVVRTRNDAWNNQIQYIYDNNLATSICDRTTTNITLRVCNNVLCTIFTAANNVAYIVVSGGPNFNNQTAGNQAVAAPVVLNTYLPGLAVDNYAGDFTRATDEYDDIVKWVTLPELQTKIGCTGCVAYEVYNSGGVADFRNNVTGACYSSVPVNTFITSLSRGGSVERHTNGTTCGALISSVTYNLAAAADVNRNCQVNYPNALPLTDR